MQSFAFFMALLLFTSSISISSGFLINFTHVFNSLLLLLYLSHFGNSIIQISRFFVNIISLYSSSLICPKAPLTRGLSTQWTGGSLYLFSIFCVPYFIIYIFTHTFKILSYFCICKSYYFYLVCVQYICSYFIIFLAFFCIMLTSIYFYSNFLFRTIKV